MVLACGGPEHLGSELDTREGADRTQHLLRPADQVLVEYRHGPGSHATREAFKPPLPLPVPPQLMREFPVLAKPRGQQCAGIPHDKEEPIPLPVPACAVAVDTALRQVQHHRLAFAGGERVEDSLLRCGVVSQDGARQFRQVARPERTALDGFATGTRQLFFEGVIEPEKFPGTDDIRVHVEHASQERGSTMRMAQNEHAEKSGLLIHDVERRIKRRPVNSRADSPAVFSASS